MGRKKLPNNEQLPEFSEGIPERLTNNAAIGYMIMAARDLDIEREAIQDMESAMRDKMDFYSEKEATEIYRSFS